MGDCLCVAATPCGLVGVRESPGASGSCGLVVSKWQVLGLCAEVCRGASQLALLKCGGVCWYMASCNGFAYIGQVCSLRTRSLALPRSEFQGVDSHVQLGSCDRKESRPEFETVLYCHHSLACTPRKELRSTEFQAMRNMTCDSLEFKFVKSCLQAALMEYFQARLKQCMDDEDCVARGIASTAALLSDLSVHLPLHASPNMTALSRRTRTERWLVRYWAHWLWSSRWQTFMTCSCGLPRTNVPLRWDLLMLPVPGGKSVTGHLAASHSASAFIVRALESCAGVM
eukprot:809416-Amphidinium_carterae.2